MHLQSIRFWNWEWFHRTYYRVLEAFAEGRVRRLMISMPPQHGKSVGATTLLPAYLLGLDPDLRIAIASYSASLASKFNRRVQRILCSAEYGELFPDTTIKRGSKPPEYIRTADEVEIVGHEGSLLSVGREGSLTGNRVDCFLLDDLYKDAMEANSPARARELLGVVHFGGAHADAQRLARAAGLHALARRGSDRDAATARAGGRTACVGGSGAGVRRRLAGTQFRSAQNDPALRDRSRAAGEALWPARGTTRRCSTPSGRSIRCVSSACTRGVPPCAKDCSTATSSPRYDALPREIVRRANYTDTADTGDDYLCSMSYAVDTDGTIYVTDLVYSREGMEVTEGTGGRPVAAQRYAHGRCREQQRRPRIRPRRAAAGPCGACGVVPPERQQGGAHPLQLGHGAPHAADAGAAGTCAGRSSTHHLTTYRRQFRANRWHDAADVVTGIVEREGRRRPPGAVPCAVVPYAAGVTQYGHGNE